MAEIIWNEKKYEIEEGTTLLSFAKMCQNEVKDQILLAFYNDRLAELSKKITVNGTVRFITIQDTIGTKTYQRSAIFLMLKAIHDVTKDQEEVDVSVMYSVNEALYCGLRGNKKVQLNSEWIQAVKDRMQELVEQDITIEKETRNTDEVVKMFAKSHMKDKEELFQYRRVSKANLYYIEDFYDYFYGYMVPSTGYIDTFDLFLYEDGFMLQLPMKKSKGSLEAFKPQKRLFQALKQSEQWGDKLGIGTVGSLNTLIANGGINDMVLVQEAIMEKNIGDIAKQIIDKNKKVVLIAGPSSSGKTTFSHRLSIQLRANGLHPHPIAMDNYFVNREETPIDEFGNYNFESIHAIDTKQFNEDMSRLVKGNEVELPTFNFKTGKREYKGNTLKMSAGDVLVIEGIHGLNPVVSECLSDDDKFKIYISALTQLNIDEHNRIPTTDGRLIRRIVRDAKHRGTLAKDTIAMWPSVRRGEEENIFPFQENSDAMFNSALIYELAVLKQYAEPLLFAISQEEPEYQEAKRLLKFFDYFLGVSSENIPNNSIIREFIGGSCFNV